MTALRSDSLSNESARLMYSGSSVIVVSMIIIIQWISPVKEVKLPSNKYINNNYKIKTKIKPTILTIIAGSIALVPFLLAAT